MILNKVYDALQEYGPSEVDDLVKMFGLAIIEDDNLPEKNDALLINMSYLYVRSGLSEQYRKFLVLHELGHYIMHYDININFNFSMKIRRTKIENEANTFACMYLLQNEIIKDADIISLLQLHGVPSQVAIRFCEDIRIEQMYKQSV